MSEAEREKQRGIGQYTYRERESPISIKTDYSCTERRFSIFELYHCLGTTVAPALQAAQTELQKAQLEDKLEGRLERRPEREDLERRGIVSREE